MKSTSFDTRKKCFNTVNYKDDIKVGTYSVKLFPSQSKINDKSHSDKKQRVNIIFVEKNQILNTKPKKRKKEQKK